MGDKGREGRGVGKPVSGGGENKSNIRNHSEGDKREVRKRTRLGRQQRSLSRRIMVKGEEQQTRTDVVIKKTRKQESRTRRRRSGE